MTITQTAALSSKTTLMLFISVPEEAAQLFWRSLEPHVDFEDDPRWMRVMGRITPALALFNGVGAAVLLLSAIYGLLIWDLGCASVVGIYAGGVGTAGFAMAVCGIVQDRRRR